MTTICEKDLIKIIEYFLPMTYQEFQKLNIDEQQEIIDLIKPKDNSKNNFIQKFRLISNDNHSKKKIYKKPLNYKLG